MADRPGKTWRWEMPWLVSGDAEVRYLRPDSKRLLSLVLLFWLTGTGAPTVAGMQQPELPVSFIEIPLRLSLEPLIDAAEKLLPYQAGNWRTWKDWHGIPSQYRGWRGPLSIAASGNVLWVQAHVRYWIRAQKSCLAWLTQRPAAASMKHRDRQ
jgi:hypothetical protein